MAEVQHSITIALTVHRCVDCGRHWALEVHWAGTCPICAYKRVNAAIDEQARLERVVRSLRGALTRAKGRGR